MQLSQPETAPSAICILQNVTNYVSTFSSSLILILKKPWKARGCSSRSFRISAGRAYIGLSSQRDCFNTTVSSKFKPTLSTFTELTKFTGCSKKRTPWIILTIISVNMDWFFGRPYYCGCRRTPQYLASSRWHDWSVSIPAVLACWSLWTTERETGYY